MMTAWTDAAKSELQRYFDRIRPGLLSEGADAEEVIEDLKRHLDAETRSAKVITEHDVRNLLSRIGAPDPERMVASGSVAAARTSTVEAPKPGVWLLLLGVILPAGTLFIELVTGMCAGAFFDPLPSFWHILMVALVPVSNGLVWRAIRQEQIRRFGWLGLLNGVAIAVGLFYSFLFIPLLLPGVFAIIFYGIGFLPLTPVLSLAATLELRRRLQQVGPDPMRLSGLWRGLAFGLALLTAVQLQELITRVAMQRAIQDNPATRISGLRWLRAVGDEDRLLRACYGFTQGAQDMDMLGWIISGADRISADQAREMYFRVTGRPFNSVPAPNVRTGRGAWAELDDWTWDSDQGGDRVGGRIKGLSLYSSRQDTIIHSEAALCYTEWILEFKNDSAQQREARAQILLPPGGVVSRLTLWVNGEEREAAFAGRAKTRAAYQKVAIRERRDPVLVTTSGPDRIMMQCFPVPPSGGLMKVRIGITAPLTLQSASEGLLRVPQFLERNFTVKPDFLHAVWVQSPGILTSGSNRLEAELSGAGQHSLRGQLTENELGSPQLVIQVRRPAEALSAWTRDKASTKERFIRQTINAVSNPAPGSVVFVLDGSIGMARHWDSIVQALKNLPDNIPCTVIIASDKIEALAPSPGGWRTDSRLEKFHPHGGQDSVPALVEAWNLAARAPGGVVVWVHGPQPVLLSPVDTLVQAMERSANGTRVIEVLTESAADRILEKLEGQRAISSWLRTGDLESDLIKLINTWNAASQVWVIERSPVATQAEAEAAGAVEADQHLARLWAKEEVQRLPKARRLDEAVELAATMQIVTPVSGAVVLETMQQFTANGLTPADPQTVPAVPEPGAGLILILGLLGVAAMRRRNRCGAP